MAQNNNKQQRNGDRELFEEAGNAGGMGQDAQHAENETGRDNSGEGGLTDNDSGDSQNVADENTQTLGNDNLDHARNKASEGVRQNRD